MLVAASAALYLLADPERLELDDAVRRATPGQFVRLTDGYTHFEIAGPSIAGLLVQAITAPFAILVDAISFVVSAFAIGSIRAPEQPRRLETNGSLRADLAAGLRYVAREPLMRAVAGSAATLNFFGMAMYAVIVLYAVRELGLSAGLVGLVFAGGAVGGLIGTQIAARAARRLGAGPAILWATVGSGIRNARAISSVVRPPSRRNVSATRASEESTGWQTTNTSRSRSSPM